MWYSDISNTELAEESAMNFPLMTFAGFAMFCLAACAADTPAGGGQKVLTVFFTKTNNTKAVAEHIQSRVGGKLFQVETKKPYPQDYQETTTIARSELDNNLRPEIAAALPKEEVENFDAIFVGYPIWWGMFPMAIATFLEQYDFSGKTVIPFCTHGGSGLSRSARTLAELVPNAVVKEGLAVRGSQANRSQDAIDAWLRKHGFTK